LRWTPDAVTWFDYTTTPPTLHCKRRSELSDVSLDLNAGDVINGLRLNPRYDLRSAYVLIRYERAMTQDGVTWLDVTEDKAPDPLPTDPDSQFNALAFTVDLQGRQSTTARARLVVEALDPSNPNWWLKRHPQFRPQGSAGSMYDPDPNGPIASFELVGGSVQRSVETPGDTDHGYQVELLDGQIADWMNFAAQRVRFDAKVNIVYRNGQIVTGHPVSYSAQSTNATGGSFQSQQTTAYAEPVPVGLAQKIYDAVSVLHYEGTLSLLEQECSNRVAIGQLLNITGSEQDDWETVQAMVQQVTENVDTGTTEIEIGPPLQLSAGDLVDLLRTSRNRLIHYSPGVAISGSPSASTEVGLGNSLPQKNSPSTPGFVSRAVVSEDIAGSGTQKVTGVDNGKAFSYWTPQGPVNVGAPAPGSILIHLGDIAPGDVASGTTVRMRKVEVCQNGVSGKMYFLCSNFIPD
jgi:hypothetical protein